MAQGIIVTLLPNEQYREKRVGVVDSHLTVAYLGTVEDKPAALERFKSVVDIIARQTPPIKARVNGMGIFSNGPEIAAVDLIDSYALTDVRTLVMRAIGGDIDKRHGFTPHMTLDTLKGDVRIELDIKGEDVDVFDFLFDRVALWAGESRYEVALTKGTK